MKMNNLAASREVSKPKIAAKPYAPRGGESDPERLSSIAAIMRRENRNAVQSIVSSVELQ